MKFAKKHQVEGQFKRSGLGSVSVTGLSKQELCKRIISRVELMSVSNLEDVYQFIKYLNIK